MNTLQIGKSWLPELPGGGLDRMFFGLAAHLPRCGVNFNGLVAGSHKVISDSNGRCMSFAREDASLVDRYRGARRAIRQSLADNPADLVAIHFAVYAFPGLGILRKLPRVIHFHGPWALESAYEGNSQLNVATKMLIEKAVYRNAGRYIVLSKAFANVLSNRYGIPTDRIRIVPGGVDAARFSSNLSRESARAQLGWPQDRQIVLSVRRLAHRMGLENLIEAAAALRKQHPELLVLIAGKGPIEDQLQKRIEEAELSDTVRLLGFVPDDSLPLAYRASDLTVTPTVSLEGFGLVTIESLASGTPVMVTPVGGLPEVVKDLSHDLVLPGSDLRSLQAGLSEALSGHRTLPDASACKTFVRKNYDWPVIAAKTRTVYEEVLS
ncbi:MAG: glycosyltransferase family 4 protein [Rhodothermales bacterium]